MIAKLVHSNLLLRFGITLAFGVAIIGLYTFSKASSLQQIFLAQNIIKKSILLFGQTLIFNWALSYFKK